MLRPINMQKDAPARHHRGHFAFRRTTFRRSTRLSPAIGAGASAPPLML